LLAGLGPLVPRLKKIWVDGAYSGKELAKCCEEQGGWELEVVERDREARCFEVVPKRWIVERTFRWLRRDRRQGLRAEGAHQRGTHRGVDDPAPAQASSERRINRRES
jgi:transposase